MLERIVDLCSGRRVVVLTGAGCSTESGIPDYRGPASAGRVRKPVQYQDFVRSPSARARYWSRSAVGWERISAAKPNTGHAALAALEAAGVATGIITQNVDGLHHAAGSKRVVELHGSLAIVRCLTCGTKTSRADFQHLLLELNGEFMADMVPPGMEAAPDGDAELNVKLDDFIVPNCECGGIMKPDVVFFGENVPRDIVDQAWQLFDDGDVLLVVGSSLTVYSGRRFVYRAQQEAKPVAVINLGPTRADDIAAIKLDAPIGETLPRLANALAFHA